MHRWILLAFFACAARPQTAPPPAPETQAREIIQSALADKNPDTRKQAATALSLGGPHEPFLAEVEGLMNDKDVEVRLAAISSLAEWKTKSSLALLRTALNDEVPEVSFAAARALYNAHDPAGKALLLAVLAGDAKVASGFITKQKRDALRMLHTPRTTLMFGLKQGIGFVPVPGLGEGISSLQGLLTDAGVSGRAMAALLLGREKDAATAAALRDALDDKDWSVRAAAVHSLALRNDPSVQKDLVPLFEDKHQGVRLRAAAAYLRLEWIRKPARTRR